MKDDILFLPSSFILHPFEFRGVRVTDRNRECVRRVIGLGDAIKLQQQLDHLLNLHFLRASVSHDRLLDLQRRVLVHGKTGLRRGEQSNTACLTH